jgi:hypothetical protein
MIVLGVFFDVISNCINSTAQRVNVLYRRVIALDNTIQIVQYLVCAGNKFPNISRKTADIREQTSLAFVT